MLQALTEAFILVSYGVAVVFITSLALLLLEIAGVGAAVHGLLDARLIDTALGCAIGFACGVLILPRRSRSRLAAVQARAIRTTSRALLAGLRGAPEGERRAARRAVHLTLVNLDADPARRDRRRPDEHLPRRPRLADHPRHRAARPPLARAPARRRRPPAAASPPRSATSSRSSTTSPPAPTATPLRSHRPPRRAFLDWPRTERAVTALRDTVAEFSG